MKITIEIADSVYNQIHDAVKDLTGPPVRKGDRYETPLLYPNPVEDWLAEVVGQNIGNIVRHRPTPEIEQFQAQIAALDAQAKAMLRPKVAAEKT